MISKKYLSLLQFNEIVNLVKENCFSERAKALCESIRPNNNLSETLLLLNQTNSIKNILANNLFFPSVEHDDIYQELALLKLQGGFLTETQLLKVAKTSQVIFTVIKFLKSKKNSSPELFDIANTINTPEEIIKHIDAVIDFEAQVKSSASNELDNIRHQQKIKRKESDKKFYNYLNEIRKLGYLRENAEEGFYNGRRTLAVLVDYKAEVNGFVHSKSETGKTIFIEPFNTIAINNELAELEIDERREVNRILRELCFYLQPFAADIQKGLDALIQVDFIKAKALFAISIKATLPQLNTNNNLKINQAKHPLLFLQNAHLKKETIPLSITLTLQNRVLVISGPNAGGKTIALKTIGLLQLMLQSGLLISVNEESDFCFFENILIDIGDSQSIENELSTYSAKLKSMKFILQNANKNALVLIDEFGSGTDPELGGAIAEAVLENITDLKCKAIITSHFSNVKVLAEKLNGCINGCMLFDIEHLSPKYVLSVGEPGSSYTFEVAEKVGFPINTLNKAKDKLNKEKIKLNTLLADVQNQKAKLEEQQQKLEHEEFLKKIAKEKYHVLFDTWQQKIDAERDKKIELAKLASFGEKYLKLMNEWNLKKDRKTVIQKFIDGITAETKKQDLLKKQNKHDKFSKQKIERLKPKLKVGSKVKILNGTEIGLVEKIDDEKVFVKFGAIKMNVGMENIVLVEG
jgi:DNA mismatch repair protein MutS2